MAGSIDIVGILLDVSSIVAYLVRMNLYYTRPIETIVCVNDSST